jgi:glucose-6-phosphate isomerase
MWELTNQTSKTDPALLEKAREGFRALKARKDLGFLQLPEREELWTTSEARAREIRRNSTKLVILGMGGSSLGCRAIRQSLLQFGANHELIFVDNVDSERFWKWIKTEKDFSLYHWVIISKSGNTIETLTMAEFIDQHLRLAGHKRLAHQCTVISETDDNPLMRWARSEKVPTLEIPKDVGGRFSVLTPVGLLPAAYYNVDLEQLKEGSRWALNQEQLIAELTAQTLMSWKREEWVTLFWAYSDGLKEFGLWIQQLWAESLGKAKDRKGNKAPDASTPISAIGSSDQHSILQQVMEGRKDKFLWFLRVTEAESSGPKLEKNLFDCQGLMLGKTMGDLFGAMATATRDALAQNNVQSVTLQTKVLDAHAVGALFMLFELVVGALGEVMNINAFDQPGVEHGKKIARKILTD